MAKGNNSRKRRREGSSEEQEVSTESESHSKRRRSSRKQRNRPEDEESASGSECEPSSRSHRRKSSSRRRRNRSEDEKSDTESDSSSGRTRRRRRSRKRRREDSSDSESEGSGRKKRVITEEEVVEYMAKKQQRKALNVAKKMKSQVVSGYSNDSNPFGDSNLGEKFVWRKKIERAVVQGLPLDISVKAEKKRQIERMAEIEKVKKRREERAIEKAQHEEEMALLARERARAEFQPLSERSTTKRGRPPGSGRMRQLDALGSAGFSFTPHVITVKAGEDVASKIMAFSQQGPRTVCILSAIGAICNVTLRQPATSGGTVTYEGRFEILSLSGSFLLTENGDTRSRTGGISVSLAGSDGRVLGGGVAGMLMAASPVQVVMGSFIAEGKKSKSETNQDPSMDPAPPMPGFAAPSASSTPSRLTSGESGDDDDGDADPGSPAMNPVGSVGTYNNPSHHGHILPGYGLIGGWPHPGNHQPRHDADMKTMPH